MLVFLHTAKVIALHAANDLPPEAWWLPALVILILGASALIDGLTATIPDPLMFIGLLAVTATQGLCVSWPFAAEHLRLGIIVGLGLWAMNALWRKTFKEDAFGMGDAKWSMLATACFGFMPVLFAWGFGACFAVVWIGIVRVVRGKIARVYFGPFLFIGLLIGIYWLRLKNIQPL